jgi:hypothetical protein
VFDALFYLQHTEVEIALPRRPSSGREVRRRLRDDRQRERVLGVQHGERPVRPVDLYREVVPRLGGKGCLEEDVERVVEDFERMCVRIRKWTSGICEQRAWWAVNIDDQ